MLSELSKTLTGLVAVLTLVSGSMAFANPGLVPHAAEYRIKISVLGGNLSTRLEATANGYHAESSIEPTGMSRIVARGSIIESSDFRSSADGLRPERYVSADTLSKDGQTVYLDFDWDEMAVGGTIDGAKYEDTLQENTLDRVSLQYGLMYDMLNRHERSTYNLQDADELKALNISNIGTRSLKVPFGTFEAVGIQHQTVNSSRVTTLWCAEALGYLPVVIEQHKDGKLRVRAVLTEYRPLSDLTK